MLLFGEHAAISKDPLKGSRSKVEQAYNAALINDYSFLRTEKEVDAFVEDGLLVRVRTTRYVKLVGVGHPYARPAVALFINRLAVQYHEACGEQMVLTSIVRTKNNQPRNASRRSVHPTGMAFDLRIPRTPRCRSSLIANLRLLHGRGVAIVTRENHPPHLHVVLKPRTYIAYLKRRGVKVR
jgi:hypothetical protein